MKITPDTNFHAGTEKPQAQRGFPARFSLDEPSQSAKIFQGHSFGRGHRLHKGQSGVRHGFLAAKGR